MKSKYKYIEIKPRKHTKMFEKKSELYNYWEKRFKKYSNWDYLNNPKINPKDFFDYKILTINKDGTPRKPIPPRKITEKQRDNFRKAMKKRSEEIKKLGRLREKIEKKLETKLRLMGFKGKVQIKFFGKNK